MRAEDRPAGTVIDLFARSRSTIHCDGGSIAAATIAEDGRRLAMALRSTGVQHGDRLAVLADNGILYLRSLAAAAAGGFVVVSVNTRFGPEEAEQIITRAGSVRLVTDRPLERRPPIATEQVIDPELMQTLLASHDGGPSREASSHERPEPDAPFVVFTTSGTTSAPKLVLHRQASIARHAVEVAAAFGFDEQTRTMVALPLCGVFGLNGLTAAIAGSSEIWLPPTFDAEAVAATVASQRITTMNGSDDMFHRMLATGADLSSIDLGGYGRFNSALDGIVGRGDEVGLTLTGVYGMSEVQALYSLRDPTGSIADRQKAGGDLTSPTAAVRVVDPDTGSPLDVGVDGEIQLRGPSLFAGYLAEGGGAIDHELTEAAMAPADEAAGPSWFRTGDLGRLEGPRRFTYLTRIGDVLRLGGFLVHPSEIEEVVLRRREVREAQIVAVARPGGVRPVACVILEPDAILDERAIIDHCASHLARFKVPIRVLALAEFPTTPSANGTKIQRAKLRAMAEASLA